MFPIWTDYVIWFSICWISSFCIWDFNKSLLDITRIWTNWFTIISKFSYFFSHELTTLLDFRCARFINFVHKTLQQLYHMLFECERTTLFAFPFVFLKYELITLHDFQAARFHYFVCRNLQTRYDILLEYEITNWFVFLNYLCFPNTNSLLYQIFDLLDSVMFYMILQKLYYILIERKLINLLTIIDVLYFCNMN